MAITITRDSATITSTEFFIASDSTSATYQTADVVMQLFLDLTNVAGGDTFVLRWYEKIDGTNARVFSSTTFSGAQTPVGYSSLSYVLGEGWEISLQKTGGTDRAIPWSLRTLS